MSARRWSLAYAAGGLVALVLLFLAMVGTRWGQRLDVLAFEGRKAADLGVRRAATDVMGAATLVLAALLGALAAWRAARRSGVRAALLTLAALVGAAVIARVLKVVLPRDSLYELQWIGPDNTFPSGHAALGAVLALYAVMVVPAASRRRVAVAAGCLLGAHGVVLLASGWHRPSDVAAGFALAMLLVGVLCAAAPTLEGPGRSIGRRRSVVVDRAGLWLRSTIVGVAVTAVVLALVRRAVDDLHWFDGFSLASFVLVGLGLAVPVTFSALPEVSDANGEDAQAEGNSADSTRSTASSISSAARR